MKPSEVKRFAALYERHLKLLKLQGKSKSTIDAYSLAVRRIRDHCERCPDKLTKDQQENYFSDLVETQSWSTVKIDRLGLMFFWKHGTHHVQIDVGTAAGKMPPVFDGTPFAPTLLSDTPKSDTPKSCRAREYMLSLLSSIALISANSFALGWSAVTSASGSC